MATPTKPGQRVMLTLGDDCGQQGQIGLVARRLTDWFHEHRWNVRLESGAVVEVDESDLFLVTD
jgi:hypothetical protein